MSPKEKQWSCDFKQSFHLSSIFKISSAMLDREKCKVHQSPTLQKTKMAGWKITIFNRNTSLVFPLSF